jgi:hypothetical protein
MATLEALYEMLSKAARTLDRAASQVRDIPLKPEREHISHIANAITEIYEVQLKIYPLKPELIPEHLWDMRNGDPGPALIIEGALRRAKSAAAKGDTSHALEILEFLLRCQPSGSHVKKVKAQMSRLRKSHDS